MELLTLEDVRAAARHLAGVAHRTPVLTSTAFRQECGWDAFFKAEHLQRAGAFKFRGAYHHVSSLPPEVRRAGLCAYSSGNHAQAVALVAALFGVPATICMPEDAPAVKLEATRGYGASVLLYDRQREDRVAFARRVAAERGLALVPPFDDPLIMAGQGTAALELLQDVPDLDVLVVPVGGGGLIAGCAVVAKALRPHLQVIGVETEAANDAYLSLRSGQRVQIPPPQTVADGIRTTALGELTYPHVAALVDDIVLVSDAAVLQTVRFFLLRLKQVLEPTGAVAAAALLTQRLQPTSRRRRAGVILSGGNADPSLLAAICSPGDGGSSRPAAG